ncbi:hypothetical protein HB662_14010 [Roseomonas frigidaquae]|uniref:Uncharacterized protein n=1 Tax=Falsiroseomonas frigidaquae TaxID=487318 RepID=A0ABX1F0N3_9PROT|nr:hypothetical protein [Falsiroseomonas frigidaquae]NKE45902.1 hypothetical protein [Falsiroseomonas frigidaquae]
MNEPLGGAWDVQRSIATIRTAAAQRRCLTYGEIAAANGFAWSLPVRSACAKHLEVVCAAALPQAHGMISAIVVNSENLKSQVLAQGALSGFIECARRLGLQPGEDHSAFLRQQQIATFDWAKGRPA